MPLKHAEHGPKTSSQCESASSQAPASTHSTENNQQHQWYSQHFFLTASRRIRNYRVTCTSAPDWYIAISIHESHRLIGCSAQSVRTGRAFPFASAELSDCETSVYVVRGAFRAGDCKLSSLRTSKTLSVTGTAASEYSVLYTALIWSANNFALKYSPAVGYFCYFKFMHSN